jgi:hypothetical protein
MLNLEFIVDPVVYCYALGIRPKTSACEPAPCDISWIALCECVIPVYDTSPGILKDYQLISVRASAAIVDFETVAG